MAIKDWPTADQPREKLLTLGAQSLSDSELLAIFLRTGCKGKSALDLARELLLRFGGLRALMEASQEQFCEAHGLGRAKYVQLQAILEMSKRHLACNLAEQPLLTSSTSVKNYLRMHLQHLQSEVFMGLFLSSQHRLITCRELFHGTIDSAAVYPREVVKLALQDNAAAIIFAHNHPSGDTEPSLADIDITKRLKAALELVDIRTLDHLIVGGNSVVSLAERGCI